MEHQIRSHILVVIFLLAAPMWSGMAYAQESPVSSQQPLPSSVPNANSTVTNGTVPCVEPPPLLRLQDYDGPLKKTVGLFARKLERKAVHPPHYQPGLMLCSLDVRDKFILFVRDTLDPVTFISAGFNAGLDQAENRDPSLGMSAADYGKRFGADFADQASFKFFEDFAYPSIFSEDPRYYRLSHGSNERRLWHAVNHAFVARRDNGDRMFNFSEWMGTVSVVALSNVYHPGNERGVSPAARQVGYNIAEDIGVDVLREFWPEIAHKFRLPFHAEPAAPDAD